MTSNPASVGPAPDGLLPCPNPWCEGSANAFDWFDTERQGPAWRVQCGCGVRAPKAHSEAGAIAAWNARAPHPDREAEPTGGVAGAESLRDHLEYARDLLMERRHGSPARSPGHNARLVIEAALQALSVSPPVVEGSLRASPCVPTEGHEAAVVGLETVETSWAYEYRNRHSDGEWKRSSFHKSTGGIPTTRAEAAAMVEKKAQHWIGGTELRLVERVTTTSPADVFISPLPVTERDAWGIYQAAPDAAPADTQPGIFALRENEPKARHQPTTPGEQGEEG